MTKRLAEAPYEMTNLSPKLTGLPFVVWISVRGGARHDVRVKVSCRTGMVSVSVRPDVLLIDGSVDTGRSSSMQPNEFLLLKDWIVLNRATLVSHWEGDIDSQEALEALVKV
jgi:hypothetical protein